jgi:hypothetical protein
MSLLQRIGSSRGSRARLFRAFGRRSAAPALLRLAPAQVFAQRRSKTPLTVAGFLCVIVVTNPSHLPHYPPARVLRKLSHRHCLTGGHYGSFRRVRAAPFLLRDLCCRSSVVEHPLGKGEVECSIHSGSTTAFVRVRLPRCSECVPSRPIIAVFAGGKSKLLFGLHAFSHHRGRRRPPRG